MTIVHARSLIATLMLLAYGRAALAAPSVPVAATTFSLTAAREIIGVAAPQISPDARRVVYVRSHADYKADKYRTELVLVEVASKAARVLTYDRDGVSAPQWSPAGDRIAYLASPATGKPPQIYMLSLEGGDSHRITDAKNGVSAFAWKPDGLQFAFATQDDAPNVKAAKAHNDAFEVSDEHFLTRTPSVPTHLWVIGADGSGARQLTHGAASIADDSGNPVWSPDSRSIYVTRQPDATFAHFTRATTMRFDTSDITEHPAVTGVQTGRLVISSDGSALAFATPRHGSIYLQSDAFVTSADGSARADTRGLDRNVHWFAFTSVHDMPALAVATADGVRNVLWSLPLDGGSATKIDLGDIDFAPDATVARDGTIAFVGQRRDTPPAIFVRAPDGTVTPVSDDNPGIARYTLGRSERIDWTTDDGLAACGVLTYPPNAVPGRRYPLVLVIHGGPVSTSTWNFSVLPQVLAARGYLVFQPNYRGSDDLGDRYLQAIVGHVTSGPGRDNLAGLAAVEKLGIVDTARIGVSGWSGGGLQTSWLIGHAHVWKAAVSGAAVNDWYEQAVLADINEEFARVFMAGVTPWTTAGRAAYAAESPISYTRAITTPTLILSDTGDQRVPLTQSYALYHALKAQGTPVRFTAFPRAGHFPTDPVGREAVFRTWTGWFDRWLK